MHQRERSPGNQQTHTLIMTITFLSYGQQSFHGTSANDRVLSLGSYKNIMLDEGDNFLYSSGDSNRATSGYGDDRFYMFGGNQEIVSSGGSNIVETGNGDDRIEIFGGGNNVIETDGGRDSVWLGDGNDSVNPGDGDDFVFVASGDDTVYAGTGDDHLTAVNSKGYNIFWGEDGNDFLMGGTEGDYLDGGIGKDILSGEAGSNLLWGGADADLFRIGRGGSTDIIHDMNSAEGDSVVFVEQLDELNINVNVFEIQYDGVTINGDPINGTITCFDANQARGLAQSLML